MNFRIFILALLCGFLIGCRDNIIHDLSESEANKIASKFASHNLDVQKEKQTDGKWAISLPDKDVSRGLSLLSTQRLIRDNKSIASNESKGLLASREDQKFRYERALSSEIETTLSGIPGVLESRVHLNLPLVDPVFGSANLSNGNSSASILLIADNLSVSKEELAALISGASGVPVQAVSIVISKVDSSDSRDTTFKIAQNLPISTTADRAGVKDTTKIYFQLINKLPLTVIFMLMSFLCLVAVLLRLFRQKRRFV